MNGIFGAANQNRTGDLILTKDVLYRLSHSSKPLTYYIQFKVACQDIFYFFEKNLLYQIYSPLNIAVYSLGSGFSRSHCENNCYGIAADYCDLFKSVYMSGIAERT